MKRLYEVLCYACFIGTIASYMVVGSTVQAKDHRLNTVDNAFIEQDQSTTKASSLEVVWMYGCDPCRRIKVVVKQLQEEGYDIALVSREKDKRGTRRFPSLYYLGDIGGLIRTEVGFKTAEHIKEYLGK